MAVGVQELQVALWWDAAMPDGVHCFGDSAQASCRFLGFAEGVHPPKKNIPILICKYIHSHKNTYIFPILIYTILLTIDSPADFPLGK